MIEELKDQVLTPWGEIGYITFKRTYARRLKEDKADSKTEEFWQVIKREIEASDRQLHVGFSDEEKQRYAETRLGLKWSVAGRFMWQLGTKTVDRLGLPSLQNCAFTVVDEPIRPFVWTMDMLMLGSGVGFSVQREHVGKLPKVKNRKIKIVRHDHEDADFIVPDTREGWVKLLGKTLKAHFYGGKGFTFSTQLIRGKGAPIKGFGGTASGPEELCWGIAEISRILNERAGKQLRSIDCLDIMNIIGFVVVAGNVRRSAQIAIGDHDDADFLRAKRWDLGTIPNWRAMSNNSVACEDIDDLPQLFWDTYQQGEPYGLINLRLARLCGRVGDFRYPDPRVMGFNPCAEQGLEPDETCCLGNVFINNCHTYDEFLEALTLCYRMCKHSLTLPCHLEGTERIVHQNMRMGIGVPGYLIAPEEKKQWLAPAYEHLRKYDAEYSEKHGFPVSIKLTTEKPDGTMSLLTGDTPGVHPSPAGPYFIRRVRMAASSPLVEVCRKHGFPVEPQINFDGSEDRNTVVVSFPCSVPEGTPVAAEFSWRDQLDAVRRLQREWSDNSVSCTVYYKKEDLEEIKQYLRKHYRDEIKTVSFLLYSGHGFIQAPYETITKEQYYEMVRNTTPITTLEVKEADVDLGADCAGGACPIK